MSSTVTSSRVTKRFCMKTTSSTGSGNWPAGNYCIYRKGSCPSGFSYGYLQWEARDFGDNWYNGDFPDGVCGYEDYQKLWYCCRSDGSYSTYIELPTEEPFLLISNDGHCQYVKGMSYHQQYIEVNSENTDDDSM